MKSIPCIVLSALLVFGVAPGAFAANAPLPSIPAPPQSAVFVVTYIDVSAASVPRAIGLFRRYQADSGNANVDLYQEIGRSYRFAITETWQDKAAYEAHKSAPAVTQLLAGLKDMQSAPPDSHVLQGISVGPIKQAAGGRARLYGISRFEIPAARLAALSALAKQLAEAGRAERGDMRFDALQEMDPRQNQLTVVEWWSNPEDYETHRTSAGVQKFREAVAGAATSSYDDRLYGKFN